MPNTYPLTGFRKESTEEWSDALAVDALVNGATRTRALSSGKKRIFNMRHLVSKSELDTFETFYDANRGLPVSLDWWGSNYTVLFVGPPRVTHRGAYAFLEVTLKQE